MTRLELRRGADSVVRVGHRGAAALAPENSLAAIEAAAAYSMDLVEIDVMRRDDGELVLAHGPELPPGATLLDEALELAVRLELGVQVDVKHRGLERGVIDALHRNGALDRSFVSSSSASILRAFARADPELPRSFTYPEDRLGVVGRPWLRPGVHAGLAALRALLPRRLPAWLAEVDARVATLNWTVVTPRAVDVCHALDVAVYAWTVNEPALASTLVASGIDGIITDDPRILASPS